MGTKHGLRIELAVDTFLYQEKQGEVFLLLNDVLYEPNDVVARKAVAPANKVPARVLAIDYLVNRFGPNRERWPEAALAFVGSTVPKRVIPPSGDDLPECP